ncbi:hypothetical protein [Accumulibacter sp.]|jgi:adenosylcobinamide-phosphate synthase|uniref:hypothetical protein n=1 Tax=Candidatus Accumulibacter TaxID=327159 RepID=UPI00190162EF|nr:hypothetical protein [Accumulibacter sp.]MBN8497378.1 hypothetical protein [Accumulibacter sp.]MBO3715376.1 hypothetical protein [Accumulibacter sp.]
MLPTAGVIKPTGGQAMVWASCWRVVPVRVAFVSAFQSAGSGQRAAGSRVDRVEIGPGDEADVDFMESAVGLVWRALVLWCLLLLLLGLASLVGG